MTLLLENYQDRFFRSAWIIWEKSVTNFSQQSPSPLFTNMTTRTPTIDRTANKHHHTSSPPAQKMITCACIDQYVSGLGHFNSANSRNAVKELKNIHLYATKASWQTWERLSVHQDKFLDIFWILKLAAGCIGNFMDEYFTRKRRTYLRADDEYNWSTTAALVTHLIANREQMNDIANGGMTAQRYRALKGALDEAGWSTMRPAQLEAVRKKDEGCYWLLNWVRGAVFRTYSTERLAVVGDLRLKRYALRTSVKFVSTIMREHTPLYYTNPLGWISGVVDDEGTSSEESSSESDYDSESD